MTELRAGLYTACFVVLAGVALYFASQTPAAKPAPDPQADPWVLGNYEVQVGIGAEEQVFELAVFDLTSGRMTCALRAVEPVDAPFDAEPVDTSWARTTAGTVTPAGDFSVAAAWPSGARLELSGVLGQAEVRGEARRHGPDGRRVLLPARTVALGAERYEALLAGRPPFLPLPADAGGAPPAPSRPPFLLIAILAACALCATPTALFVLLERRRGPAPARSRVLPPTRRYAPGRALPPTRRHEPRAVTPARPAGRPATRRAPGSRTDRACSGVLEALRQLDE